MKKEFNSHIERLRASNLRPTKQRIEICQFLFSRKKTFHFTVESLNKLLTKTTIIIGQMTIPIILSLILKSLESSPINSICSL